ncbi:MAG: hypothetical protein HYY28_11730 [Betaproteobacteria bacterium]|nr:hypothetical protein [Betaproteobacteria bacterium]MBI2960976.1 hypothetical protein [Betaproteobacteria bacterium]
MKTVALKILCSAGWTDAAGQFIGHAVLVSLNLESGLVSPHFENDAEALTARGPTPICGLMFEPAGLEHGASVILQPAADFRGAATGFHIAQCSLAANRARLEQWAASQATLALVTLRYRPPEPRAAEQLAA